LSPSTTTGALPLSPSTTTGALSLSPSTTTGALSFAVTYARADIDVVSARMPRPSEETIALGAQGAEVVIRQFALTIVGGPGAGATTQSSGVELVIGSSPGNDLVLADPAVSRHHCVVSATKDGFLVRDLESKNGTTVQSVRIEGAYLTAGALIGVGRTVLRFEPLDARIREPLSPERQLGGMVGTSAPMRRIFALIPRVALSDATVLIEGPTGTGKELVAEAIHEASPRRDGPLVVIDCSAIPPALIESELFGHEKGAFTGAHTARAGAFEVAAGGTIFLDEIGELPLDMQPKLLRVLEDRTVKRVGGAKAIPLDVRVVAATNRDLRSEVNHGRFRPDLYYRLNVVKLRVPPLRDRREDIPLLVAHFFRELGAGEHPPADLVATLLASDWPGNVRELRSAVERAVLLGDPRSDDEAPLSQEHGRVPTSTRVLDTSASFRVAKARVVDEWEKWFVTELLHRHGTVSNAAREAKMDRHHLGELLRRHGIRPSK
jgi:two-component system response regulator GlrR